MDIALAGRNRQTRRAKRRPRTHQPTRLGRHHRCAGTRVCQHDGWEASVLWV